jgi:hypothetical protein
VAASVLPLSGWRTAGFLKLSRHSRTSLQNNLAPQGRLPLGSVVLIGSLSHLGRYGLESYAGDMVKTMSSLSAAVGAGWGAANGLNFDIIDPSTIVNLTAPLLRKRLTSDGASLWCTGDPVHLCPDAYQDLAGAFSEEGDGSVTGEPDGSISASSEGLKRRNPESVVTLPKMPATKRGRRGQNVAAAGWLTGAPSGDAAAGLGWRRQPSAWGCWRSYRDGRWAHWNHRHGRYSRRPW